MHVGKGLLNYTVHFVYSGNVYSGHPDKVATLPLYKIHLFYYI